MIPDPTIPRVGDRFFHQMSGRTFEVLYVDAQVVLAFDVVLGTRVLRTRQQVAEMTPVAEELFDLETVFVKLVNQTRLFLTPDNPALQREQPDAPRFTIDGYTEVTR